jgi:hypothetical protein
MADLSRDPIANAINNGIKRDIRVALENNCLGAAVILVLSGMDTMAYLGMPPNQENVTRTDFVRWADGYIKFPCKEQLTGMDLYGARCAMLHNYGTASDLSRQGKCRQVGYMDKSIPEVCFEPTVAKDVVMLSVPALAEAFFCGVDRSLIDLFADRNRASIAEQRLKNLVQAIPYKSAAPQRNQN